MGIITILLYPSHFYTKAIQQKKQTILYNIVYKTDRKTTYKLISTSQILILYQKYKITNPIRYNPYHISYSKRSSIYNRSKSLGKTNQLYKKKPIYQKTDKYIHNIVNY